MAKAGKAPRRGKSRAPAAKASVAPATAARKQDCEAFRRRRCHGCTQLHQPYAQQLAAKAAHVGQLLDAALGAAAKGCLEGIVASPAAMGYRGSAKLCLHEDREGRAVIGLYRPGTHLVEGIGACPAQTRQVNDLVAEIFPRGLRPPARFYRHQDRVFQRQRLKFLMVRAGADGTGGVLVAHTGVDPLRLKSWLGGLGRRGISIYATRLTPADGTHMQGQRCEHVAGPEYFSYRLGECDFELTPMAFFQANSALAPALVQGAVAFRQGGELLLDLYGGFGAYSCAARASFAEMVVVDTNAAAIAAAARAATKAAVKNLSAVASGCEAFIAANPDLCARATHALVNPPRQGLSKQMLRHLTSPALAGLKALNYVSCSPETLCRDLQALVQDGWRLWSVRPYDMFPQTTHVEVVARLERG